jgi:hypothetical protein
VEFWLDLTSNVIGTFVGAGLALMTSFLVVRHGEKKNDVRLVQALVDRLYRSRALRPGRLPGDYSLEAVREDQKRGTKSVLATRDRIALTSDELSSHSQAFDELDAMHVACLRYLNAIEEDPSRYVQALMELRAELEPVLRHLCDATPGVQWREIGTADLRNRLTGPQQASPYAG